MYKELEIEIEIVCFSCRDGCACIHSLVLKSKHSEGVYKSIIFLELWPDICKAKYDLCQPTGAKLVENLSDI